MSFPRRRALAGAAAAVLAATGSSARAASRAGTVAGPDFGALARALDGRLILPGDADYAEARQLFQPRYDSVAPGAVAYPAHADDVAVCLDFARRSATPVVPRGGGHSYAGWSTVAAGLVVDVGAMARVTVGSGEVRVGAGARLADVHAALAARGLAVPAGLCPSVGIAGLALGGGLGLASRAHGTTSDRLAGARVVTPDGVVREVDARHDPDLFWALRGGGGGNFGVVTEFRLRPHRTGDVAFAELHWSGADSAAVVRGWQRWLGGLPDPFWSQAEFTVGAGAAALAVRVTCLDGRAELERQLSRLTGLVGREPQDSWVVVRSYGDTVRAMAGCSEGDPAGCRLPGRLPGRDPKGRLGRDSYAARSDFWGGAGLPDAAVDAVLDAVRRYGREVPSGGLGVVQFDGVCGGAVNRVPASRTAFVHRDSAFLAQYLVYWPPTATAAEVDRHQGWLDGLWQDLRRWAGGRAYQNYADPKLTGWREAYYGPNLPRLERVRRTYDPARLLRFPRPSETHLRKHVRRRVWRSTSGETHGHVCSHLESSMAVRRVVPNIQSEAAQESREFYGLLGFEEVMNHGWIMTLASPSTPAAQISVMTSDKTAPVTPDMSVEVDDVDAAYAVVRASGAEIVHPLQDEEWGVRRFFVRDPSGRVVNVLGHR